MRKIVSLCVRHPGAVSALALLALILGIATALQAPLDVFPEFVPSQVDIQTEAPGFSPQQVEELVTRRVESAVNGASGLATLRSESIPGLSVVTITFADSVDVRLARQGVSERLSELGNLLPTGVGTPRLSSLVSSTMDLLKIGLLSERVDAFTLRDSADWVIKPRLLAVPGVAHVIVFGGSQRQIQISPDPRKLVSYHVTLTDLADAGRAALALRGAGYIDLRAQRILLTLPTPSPDLDALRLAVVTVRNGLPIHLGDVAEVTQSAALRSGDSLIMGRRGVLLSLASQHGANTLETTRAVEKVLAELKPALAAQGITVYPALHRPANFVERALHDLGSSLAIAAILVIAVLYGFLRDWRAALIAFIAIPLSLLASIAVLDHLGYTLNTMTLGGFAVALGVLVDDAIIDLENIVRRLDAHACAADPAARAAVIIEASLEVRAPVVYATVVVIAVFLPELFTSGVQGHFVGPLALAFILAVLASLAVAMLVTPALCALLFRRRTERTETRWLAGLKSLQVWTVHACLAHFKLALAVVAALLAAAITALPYLGGVFMPDFREGHFVLQVSSAVGTSLDETLGLGSRISADLLRLPYVVTVEQQAGRAESGEDTWGTHQSEFHVEIKPDTLIDQRTIQEQLRTLLHGYPGTQSEVVTFLGDRISESLTGDTAEVVVKIYGDDLAALDAAGKKIAQTLGHIAGVVDLQFKREVGTPIIRIDPEPGAVAAVGLTNQAVFDAIHTAYSGTTVGQIYSDARSIDAVLLLSADLRRRPEELRKLLIRGPLGAVPLGQVAKISVAADRYRIEHESGQRRVSVTCNVQGRNLQSVVMEARDRIADEAKLSPGFLVEFTGAAQAASTTQRQLVLYSALALGLIGWILFIAFRWRVSTLLVLANLPFSLIGGVLAIAVTGIGISLGSALGLATVFGISARNAILQMAHYEHLVEVEHLPWNLDTVLRGANERFVPILMTAAVTALALAPLALSMHRPGQEIEGPMAITVLGGLLSSTLLNLFLLPALTQRFIQRP